MIKQQVNIQELIESFLPHESQDLVKIVRNAESANVKIDLFAGYLNLNLNLKLSGTKQLFDMIM